MTSTICALIPASSSPAAACRTARATFARDPPGRAARTRQPRRATLDIDDTVDVVHGHQ